MTKKKRRPSGYNLFIKKCRTDNNYSFGQALKECGPLWKGLTEAEKEKIRKIAKNECHYDEDENKWSCEINDIKTN